MDFDEIERSGLPAEGSPGDIPAEIALLQGKLDMAWEILVRLNAASHWGEDDGETSEEERASHLQQEIVKLQPQIDNFVWGEFSRGGRVEVVVVMERKGDYFPAGVHRRFGRIVKSGTVENSWLVELDEPIGEERMITLPTCCLRSLP